MSFSIIKNKKVRYGNLEIKDFVVYVTAVCMGMSVDLLTIVKNFQGT